MRLLLSLLLLLGGVSSKACTTKAIQSASNLDVLAGQDPSSSTTSVSTPVTSDQTNSPTTPGSSPGSASPTTASSISADFSSSSSSTTPEDEECTTDGPSTITGATIPVATTTPVVTTTLPPVNVSVVQFSMGTCSNGFCSYTYIAPMNDPNFLNTEQTYIDTDQLVYQDASKNVNIFQSKISGTTDEASKLVADLRTQLQTAQGQLDTMQQQLAWIINNTNMAASNVAAASYFVDRIDPTQPCYWQCKQPPTTPTTTTTTTTPPTPTPGPCQSGYYQDQPFKCPLTSGSSLTTPASSQDVCTYNKGRPYCTNCDGNMDGYQQCEASRCDQDGYNVALGFNWSPGYNGTKTNMTSLPAGATCAWDYPTPYQFSIDKATFDFSTIGLPGDTPQLYIYPDNANSIGTYTLNYLTTNAAKINNWLKNNKVQNYQIILTTPITVSPGTYFFFKSCIDGASCT